MYVKSGADRKELRKICCASLSQHIISYIGIEPAWSFIDIAHHLQLAVTGLLGLMFLGIVIRTPACHSRPTVSPTPPRFTSVAASPLKATGDTDAAITERRRFIAAEFSSAPIFILQLVIELSQLFSSMLQLNTIFSF